MLSGGPEPVPGGVAEVDVERADDRTAMSARRTSLQLRGRGLRRVAGQEREHAQPIGSDGVELLDGPVVPRRVTGALQLGVVDREAERERSVDHRDPQAVAVHVLEPELGRAGTEAVVLDAGASDRAQLLRDLAVRRDAAAAHHAVFAHPDGLAVPRHDVRTALGLVAWQPRLPHVGRHRVQVQVVVAGVDAGRGIHAVHSGAFGVGRPARNSFIGRGGGPAVVPPSTGKTIPVICAARSLDKVEHRLGHVARRSEALQRLHGPHDCFLVERRVDRGRDVRRRDAVHADAVFGELDRDRPASGGSPPPSTRDRPSHRGRR